MKIKHYLVIILCFVSVLAGRSQVSGAGYNASVSVTSRLNSQSIMVGDPVELKIQVTAPTGIRFLGLETGVQQSPGVEVLSESGWDTVPQQSGLLLEKRLVVSAYDSGYHKLAPAYALVNNGGKTDTFLSEPSGFTVTLYPKADSIQLMPIKPIIEEPLALQDVLFWPAVVLLLATLLGGLYWYIRYRKRQKNKTGIEAPVVSAYDAAKQPLQQLQQEKTWQQTDVKGFYSQLTDVLRRYLEHGHNIPALESTSSEIIGHLKSKAAGVMTTLNDASGLSESFEGWNQHLMDLQNLLQRADMVKFAKTLPTEAVRMSDTDTIVAGIDFLHAFEPKPETETKKGI